VKHADYRNRVEAARLRKNGAMADDPVLVITGASSGIGAATARHASEGGYRLVLGARREAELRKLATELGGEERAAARRCDVSDWSDVEGLAETAMERFGRIDAVFANAGFGATRGFLEESPEHWRAMVDTNVLGVALTIRATLPHLLEAGRGHYLITGSVAGKRVLPGSLYSATKWAVGAIAEALRQELRQMHDNAGIRVTLIAPGMVDTPFFDQRPESDALDADDVARAAIYALTQPDHVDVNELLVRPVSQPT
jgi:NADP-dependent 3-hydroxy acid dehydrogenase YdfG